MQGLAKCGLLGHFKYLSTVSGGGYIGSWLTAWIHRKAEDGTVADPFTRVIDEMAGRNLPTGTDGEVLTEAVAITQLRRFSNYLAPQPGLLSADTWALVATILRNIILNWFVLIPVLVAVLALPRLIAVAILAPSQSFTLGLIAAGVALCAWTIAYVSRKRVLPHRRTVKPSRGSGPCGGTHLVRYDVPHDRMVAVAPCPRHVAFRIALDRCTTGARVWDTRHAHGLARLYPEPLPAPKAVDPGSRPTVGEHVQEMLAYVLTGFVGGAILRLVAHAFDGTALQGHDMRALTYAAVAPTLFLFSFTLAATILVGLASAWMSEEDREWWSRFGAWALIRATVWTAVSVVVLLLPQWIAGGIILPIAAAATMGCGALTILGGLSKKTIFQSRSPAQRKGRGEVVRSRQPRTKVRGCPRPSKSRCRYFLYLGAAFLSLVTDLFVGLRTLNSFAFRDVAHDYLKTGLHLGLRTSRST